MMYSTQLPAATRMAQVVTGLRRLFLIAVSSAVLAGCASQLPQSIRGDGTPVTSYEQVRADSEATIGQTVRWGGVIAEVRNGENSSEIEVVGFKLRSFGRPEANDDTYGRFRVVVDGFIDPEVYARGRMVTVLGTYQGLVEGQIGEFNYQFPLVQSSGVELWQEVQPRNDDWRYDIYSPRYRWYMYGVGPYRVHPYVHPYGPFIDNTPPPRSEGTRQPVQQRPAQSVPPRQQPARQQID